MDDPGCAWPFWKFGLQKDDLTTTLHDRFNTIPSAIQDPEAFHHDVYEISTRASTLTEFENLMEERKKLRLEELNGMLEDASFEIIGNPSLIGTEQWQYAIQLFRTKSLDSLVRYFSSYLPQEHPWHHDSASPISSTGSSQPAIFDCDGPMFFDEPEEDDTYYTNEHSQTFDITEISLDQPTRSMTVRSEDSGVSVSERVQQNHKYLARTSQRAMSFSESESEPIHIHDSIPALHDDDVTSQSDDPETPSTSVSDLSDTESQGKDTMLTTIVDDDAHDEYLSITHAQLSSMDSMESETPTPKPERTHSSAAPFFDTRLSPLRARSLSSSHTYPHHAHPAHEDFSRQHATTRQLRRRDTSVDRQRSRYESRGRSSRVQKPTVEPRGIRQRGRRHVGA
ncbi:hypothetical protein KVR01_007045 [Diaporthe batatas]|uniref:uncharacterized protein n=1 Tax=Diaporthe batatas TaxID=748121 RepID=UPI001D04704D|nr:uncharacterized protein KVR01_007045 [Diaporthe batatas]KAG8163748.1 hypothetical protein KVR01_007045 [Diaporthe batatas]